MDLFITMEYSKVTPRNTKPDPKVMQSLEELQHVRNGILIAT